MPTSPASTAARRAWCSTWRPRRGRARCAGAHRPAYDYEIQALTGVMAITGEPGGAPAKTGYSAVDNSAGMMGALGLLAKVLEGEGGQIDLSMHDVMLS